MKKNIYKILGLLFLLSFWVHQIKAQSGYTPGPSTVYVCDVDEGARLGGKGGDDYCYRWEPTDFLDNDQTRNPLAKPTSDIDYTVTVLDDKLNVINQQTIQVIIEPEAKLEEINIEEVPCCLNAGTEYNYATLNVQTVPEELVGTLLFDPQVATYTEISNPEFFGVKLDDKVKVTATCKNEDDDIMEKTITIDIVEPNFEGSIEASKIGKEGDFNIKEIFSNIEKVTDEIKKATDLKPGSGCNFEADVSCEVAAKVSPECCPGHDGYMGTCIYAKTSFEPSGSVSYKLEDCGFTFPLGPDGGILSQYLVECGLELSAEVGLSLSGGLYWSCEQPNPDVCMDLELFGSIGMEAFAQALKGFGKVSFGITARISMPVIHLCTNDTGSNSVLSGEFCLDADANVSISALWGGITIANFNQNLYHHCKDYF